MRRWKRAHTEFSNYRTHGLAVEQMSETAYKYTYIECDDRTRYFEERLYRVPLPQDELDGNKAVTQYKEWK